jgi:hypothetical protein
MRMALARRHGLCVQLQSVSAVTVCVCYCSSYKVNCWYLLLGARLACMLEQCLSPTPCCMGTRVQFRVFHKQWLLSCRCCSRFKAALLFTSCKHHSIHARCGVFVHAAALQPITHQAGGWWVQPRGTSGYLKASHAIQPRCGDINFTYTCFFPFSVPYIAPVVTITRCQKQVRATQVPGRSWIPCLTIKFFCCCCWLQGEA